MTSMVLRALRTVAQEEAIWVIFWAACSVSVAAEDSEKPVLKR